MLDPFVSGIPLSGGRPTAEADRGLSAQLKAFQTTLLPSLTTEEFADMYAQTLVYGLFAARVARPKVVASPTKPPAS